MGETEVIRPMLGLNIPVVLMNVLFVAFLVIVLLAIAIGAYAATVLKKREQEITIEE